MAKVTQSTSRICCAILCCTSGLIRDEWDEGGTGKVFPISSDALLSVSLPR